MKPVLALANVLGSGSERGEQGDLAGRKGFCWFPEE